MVRILMMFLPVLRKENRIGCTAAGRKRYSNSITSLPVPLLTGVSEGTDQTVGDLAAQWLGVNRAGMPGCLPPSVSAGRPWGQG